MRTPTQRLARSASRRARIRSGLALALLALLALVSYRVFSAPGPSRATVRSAPAQPSVPATDQGASLRAPNEGISEVAIPEPGSESSVRSAPREDPPQEATQAETFADVPEEPEWSFGIFLDTPQGEPLMEALRGEPRVAVRVIGVPLEEGPPELLAGAQTLRGLDITQAGSKLVRAGRLPDFQRRVPDPDAEGVFLTILVAERVQYVERIERPVLHADVILDPEFLLAQLATVRLRVERADGLPLENALVLLRSQSLGLQQRTDASGRASFERLVGFEGRKYQLLVSAQGWARHELAFELSPGQVYDLGTIRLSVPVRIVGTIIGDEQEVAHRTVKVRSLAPAYEVQDRSVEADKEGRFQIEDLTPGRYALRVDGFQVRAGRRRVKARVSRWVVLDLKHAGVEHVELRLEDLETLRIFVNFPGEENVRITVVDENGQTYGPLSLCPDDCQWHPDLPAGRYRIRVERNGLLAETEVNLGAGGAEAYLGP